MDNSTSIEQDLESPQQPKIDKQAAKRRKVVHKHVVRVKINEGNAGKQKSEGPPSDTWSWRKYGQKPIKGSPYPRGYYRCSTSKGCSAKKQVERCKTDASMLIVTYTSSHNHAGPDILCTNPTKTPLETKSTAQEEDSPTNTISCGPASCSHLEDIISQKCELKEEAVGNDHDHLNMMSIPPTPPKSCEEKDDDDFFDDLEELPMSSSLTSFVRSCFFDERILLPS